MMSRSHLGQRDHTNNRTVLRWQIAAALTQCRNGGAGQETDSGLIQNLDEVAIVLAEHLGQLESGFRRETSINRNKSNMLRGQQ